MINTSSITTQITQTFTQLVPKNPCNPSPCGNYAQCRVANEQSVCSCMSYCTGTPPHCRPECTVNEECSTDMACTNQKCISPCPGACGLNSHCTVRNHSPVCSCKPGFMGDPFTRCLPIKSKIYFKKLSSLLWTRLSIFFILLSFYISPLRKIISLLLNKLLFILK